jgi:hypothetical protein
MQSQGSNEYSSSFALLIIRDNVISGIQCDWSKYERTCESNYQKNWHP